jgi:hypothetical protein
MQVNFVHLRERATSGDWLNFAAFEARFAACTKSVGTILLPQLTSKARAAGLVVDQSTLAFA